MTHQPESHPRKGHRQTRLNVPRIVKDIRYLSASIDRQWRRKSNRVTCGVAGDAQHLHDFAALDRVVTWTLARPWTSGRMYQVAIRLRLALQDITLQQEAEVRLQLRIAARCVVRTLVKQQDGSWVRMPMKDAA